MARMALEDNAEDIIGKAQRGLGLSAEEVAARAGVTRQDLAEVLGGQVREAVLVKVARSLGLGGERLIASARKAWMPAEQEVEGLLGFATPYHGMMVNAYLAWDGQTLEAVAFDTGADCGGMLGVLRERKLRLRLVLLTHTHSDHIADLARLQAQTGARVFVSEHEPMRQAETFADGKVFVVGGLRVQARRTSGHSPGGTTYVVEGLGVPVAVVGDALFAGSMGGGLVSYEEALANNRRHIFSLPDATVLCPGHGPMTTVGEEKRHNPFFPEYDESPSKTA